ncbi:exosortase D (VPLPA-CTERM-specific) [Povalibacter uvarum]|uniref:Exosortase D (VPLPA-CTERM-specific) n=1 Tax=Povalibacter uvarum TaxID=732238 RepID=A0A841HGQ4_9GAMM|nr:VPLPA-CTERM-specific exosortase XrtD [Povalibacter uvarum]MBB6091265.1 exosortase D (VPLPA-CTERM-specific) [Povalibacter uvarum]
MSVHAPQLAPVYRLPPVAWIAFVLAAAGVCFASYDAVVDMWTTWQTREEYSHGVLIPIIAAFLVWQQRDVLERNQYSGSWWGVALVSSGLLLSFLGAVATLYVLQQYALLLLIYGLVVAFGGWSLAKALQAPLLMLIFMVPLPAFLLHNMSSELQLLSSQIGVWVVRLFGISVFVEGNVIDLGVYKLQVAEACDGLRYLFPLMTLGFLMAYFFKVALWKRITLFLLAIPVTILMNSIRIGIIGVMVEHWGTSMAEGFLHDFQGWVVFMVSAAVMLVAMILLSRIGSDRRPWREVFGLELPASTERDAQRVELPLPKPFVGAMLLVVAFAAAVTALPERVEALQARQSFAAFPMQIDEWNGRRTPMEQIYLDTLKLDDYVMADFVRDGRDVTNLYVAWYDSQQAGQSAHSPRSCLPGGGWRITRLDQAGIANAWVNGRELRVNRAQIELGDQKQLVYYWFQQRGRIITNEYMVKWYLFLDSLLRHRTDGALVRVITPVRPGEQVAAAEQRLAAFTANVAEQLPRYIPN